MPGEGKVSHCNAGSSEWKAFLLGNIMEPANNSLLSDTIKKSNVIAEQNHKIISLFLSKQVPDLAQVTMHDQLHVGKDNLLTQQERADPLSS